MRKKGKKNSLFKLLLGLLIIIYMGAISYGIYVVSSVMEDAPELSVEDFNSTDSTKIYDSEGNKIAEIGLYLRENIEYDDMSQTLIDAFIATEDSRFFEHTGFDIPRFSKAILENLKSKSFSQGGSTFTMQLLKNTYFQIDADENSTIATKSIDRKLKEILLSPNVENLMSKEKILISYLNKINFGANIRGIETASRYYFGKSAKEIGLSESALLAGVINQPNGYNPYYKLDEATERRNTVLDLMLYHGYITEIEHKLAKAIKVEDLLVKDHESLNPSGGVNQAYIDAVIAEVLYYTGNDPVSVPMDIHTNLIPDVQNKMYDILQGNIEDIDFRNEYYQMAMISVENETGNIVGIGGGRDYEGSRVFNRATDMYKQPGSSIKPILTYALGFEHLGWSTSHIFTDKPILLPYTQFPIKNATNRYYGDVTMKFAFGISLNTPVMQGLSDIFDKIGKDEVSKYFENINFTNMKDKIFDTQIGIGGYPLEVTPKQLAGAYAMLYNKGYYIEPHTINRIEYHNGDTYTVDKPKGNQVLSEEAAYLTTRLTYDAVNTYYDNSMYTLKSDYPVYGKTGTSDYGNSGLEYGIPKGAAKDRWMIASTPKYTNVVWEGFDKAIKGETTWLTNQDLNKNLRAKSLRQILDVQHPENKPDNYPEDIKRPEDVSSITYMAGTFPYAYYYGESYPVTGLVKKEHSKLVNYSRYNTPINLNFNGKYYRHSETLTVSFSGLPYYHMNEEGVEELLRPTCIQSIYGEQCHTGGVKFDPYYGAGAQYGADIYVNGQYYETLISDNWPSISTWVDPYAGSIRACGYIVGPDGGHQYETCINVPK